MSGLFWCCSERTPGTLDIHCQLKEEKNLQGIVIIIIATIIHVTPLFRGLKVLLQYVDFHIHH